MRQDWSLSVARWCSHCLNVSLARCPDISLQWLAVLLDECLAITLDPDDDELRQAALGGKVHPQQIANAARIVKTDETSQILISEFT